MTKQEHARFAEWDAAYVLGSLSPAERREFEEHLDDCERCRAAVSELSALPGLLGRIDDARAFALLEGDVEHEQGASGAASGGSEPAAPADGEEAPSASLDLVARIRRVERTRRVRRTLIGVGALAAAAALASALTIAIPAALAPPPPVSDAFVGMSSVNSQPIPVDVFVNLTEVPWGTRLEMDCYYHPASDADGGYGPAEYSLWVVDVDGSEHSVSTWRSSPGSDVMLSAGTGTSLDDIAQLDLRTSDGGEVLMTGEVTPRETTD